LIGGIEVVREDGGEGAVRKSGWCGGERGGEAGREGKGREGKGREGGFEGGFEKEWGGGWVGSLY